MNELSSRFKTIKVAIVHDWLTGYRGGEKVLAELLSLFPNAPLYTLVHKKGSVPQFIESHKIHTSFIQKLPLGVSHYRHYLPLFPLAAETLLPSNIDFVISTSSAVAKSVRHSAHFHWCYIHSPMRYVWDRFDDYFGPERVGLIASKLFFRPIAEALKYYDKWTSRRVSHFVANSQFVANRVQNFYGRTAAVIHPPVAIERFQNIQRSPEDFYLFFSALVPYKRADLAIQACEKLQKKLVILGSGPELKNLKSIANSQYVRFIEKVTDNELDVYFSKAKALLFPCIEDFGIVPVEAIAAGLPVIGPQLGGLADSQTTETCEFMDDVSLESLIAAIHSFEKRHSHFNVQVMRQHAQNFSTSEFKRKTIASLNQFVDRNF